MTRTITKEINIPFTRDRMWVEFWLSNNIWLEFSIHEIYAPDKEAQKVLGPSDSRTIFEVAFRVPFRREKH